MKTKRYLLVALALSVGLVTLRQSGARADEAGGSTFSEIWGAVTSDPYALPHNRVTLASFFGFFKDKLKAAGQRTISDRSDLLPRFDKLVHPNGICLAGTWNITEENPYTGYFSKGSRGLIIARASVAMSDTLRGKYRGFGFAGKLYPTDNPTHSDKLPTANFFLVDDLGGTLATHYTDVGMTNHPTVTNRLAIIARGAAALKAFGAVDSNPLIRQMYEVSELGMRDSSQAHTPDYFMLRAAPGQSADLADFRNELRLANHGGRLQFEIFVAAAEKDAWSRIGYVEFTEDVVSDSCDHRLHFHHPRWRNDL